MSENTIESRVKSSSTNGSYASVNGINLYYERDGAGAPLVLLHGGLGTTSMFAHLVPELAKTRQTIAVELQAHGHTADIDRPLSFEAMADDVASLIRQLGLGKADVLGYSLGGGVALQTAIRHPEVLRKLVLVSAACKRSGWHTAALAGMSAMNAEAAKSMVGSPMQEAYASAAPRPEDWPVLVDKTARMLRQDYDWSESVAAMTAPVQIIVGDADAVRPSHALEMFDLLGGGKVEAGWDGSGMSNSRLAILPATSHYNTLFSPLLMPIVTSFLDAPLPETQWPTRV